MFKKFKFWWRSGDGKEWKSYIVDISMIYDYTVTTPHQQLFKEISTFTNFFLVYIHYTHAVLCKFLF